MKKLLKSFSFTKENNYKPFQISRLGLSILALVWLFTFTLNFFDCYLIRQNNLTASLQTIDIVSEINNIRKSYGLPPLIENPKLNVAALLKAQDMIEKDYFSHYSPSGVTPWDWFKTVNYNYSYAGENLALNFWNSNETIEAWLSSPTHRANIINSKYLETGVAILNGTTPTTKESKVVVVQLFGTPKQTPEIKTISKPKIITTTTLKKIVVNKTTTSTTAKIETTTTLLTTTISNINAVDKTEILSKRSEKQNIDSDKINAILNNSTQPLGVKLSIDGYTKIKNIISSKLLKAFNGTMGVGLLLIGCFGIIKINEVKDLNINYRKNIFSKNLIIIILGIGFVIDVFITISSKVPFI